MSDVVNNAVIECQALDKSYQEAAGSLVILKQLSLTVKPGEMLAIMGAIIGIVFISLIGWRLLINKKNTKKPVDDILKIQDYITEIIVPKASPMVGKTIAELEQLIKGNFVTLGLIRHKQKKLVVQTSQTLIANDILIVQITPDDLRELLTAGKLSLVEDKKIITENLRDDEIGIMEAVVPPASRIAGRSSRSARLRGRYQMNLLAISRQGKTFKTRLSQANLQAGDVILLQGNKTSMRNNMARLGLLPLMERDLKIKPQPKAYLPLIIFVIAIILAATQLLPVPIAFGGAVVFMVLLNTLPVREIYEGIDWSVIILLAAMIPIGAALQSTGGTGLISHYFIALSGHVSPIVILVLLFIITMTLSDFMNNAATTVVMAPIAMSIAEALKVNIDPFLMTVAVAASCSFLTPVGHQNNTLVMGPGGYRFVDYIKLGLPVEILVLITAVPLILWQWPLT